MEGKRSEVVNDTHDSFSGDVVPSYEDAVRDGPQNCKRNGMAKAAGNPFHLMRSVPDDGSPIRRLADETLLNILHTSLSPYQNPQAFDFWPVDYRLTGSSSKEDEVVSGLPSDVPYQIFHLSDSAYSCSFLRQPAISTDVEQALKTTLISEGNRVHGAGDEANAGAVSTVCGSLEGSSSRTFFDKLKDPSRRSKATTSMPMKLGWRHEHEDRHLRPLAADEIRVGVKVREVFVRRETPLGLLETTSFPMLWVEIEIGR